ncbi:DUF3325 domain-containing protein [Pseudoalteromonas sp. BZK2]|uniref:DUF3325 domain-containing protein n=1 Tax=Pseudoalteromonas sp. BZK2 TaxID=1904458 RepID=UPI001654299F|nr:DUF3325 domain-containing protein [Pseudoalteromonas sp. BZK2]MBC7008334.1 DUF3325 domain-containing protein [Pseudoalteromonas sp. BZK2]
MLILLEFILVTLGIVYLSFTITKNYTLVFFKRRPNRITRYLVAAFGAGFMLAAIIFALFIWGTALGFVYWFATITFSASLCVLALSFKPKVLRHFLLS